MNPKIHQIFFLVFAMFLVTACAPKWQVIDKSDKSREELNLSFTVPKGWYLFSKVGQNLCYLCLRNEDTILITKDFVSLNFIVLARFDLDEKLQPLDKKLDPNDTMFEIAEDIGNNLKQLGYFKKKFKIITVTPHSFLGRDGFELMVQFNNPDGLPYKMLIVGTIIDNYLYTAKLSAPAYYYFDDIKDEFEGFISQIEYKD